MNTNTEPCSGKAKLLLEIQSPIQASNFIVGLMPETKEIEEPDFYRSASKQTLETLINALHILDKPYTLQDIYSILTSQEKILNLRKELNANHSNSPETHAYNSLVNRYTTAHGFDIMELRLNIAGLIGRIHSLIQTTE